MAHGKGAQDTNQFTNKICYQTNKISSDGLVLACWCVAKHFRLHLHSGKACSVTVVLTAQDARRTEPVQHTCLHGLQLNLTMASRGRAAEAATAGRENRILLQCRNSPGEKMRECCLLFPYQKLKNKKTACSFSWLGAERKDNKKWM